MTSIPSTTTWTSKTLISFARSYSEEEGTILLHSGDHKGCSYLALFPDEKIEIALTPNCWEELEEKIKDDLYFGFLNYEMGCYSDPKTIPHPPAKRAALFYRPTVVIRFDHATGKATQFGKAELKRGSPGTFSARQTGASESLQSYCDKVQKIKKHIRKGDVYQVNLSQELLFEYEGSPFALFERSCAGHPYSAFVRTAQEALVSASPELFVHRKNRKIRTAPIKGTAPRGQTAEADAAFEKQLLHSEKDRAELMMIVDLLRNDLSRICSQVEVEKLCTLERFPSVFHLVSQLKGELKEDLHPIALLRFLFPGGSISGCPKLAALQLISELEKSARGPYTGAIGFIDGTREMHLNLAIRTALLSEGHMQLRLGGGIIADSDPIAEYQETLHKGKALCLTSTSTTNSCSKSKPQFPSKTAAFSSEMASSPQ